MTETFACACLRYDHTQALFDGGVKIQGVERRRLQENRFRELGAASRRDPALKQDSGAHDE